MDVRASNKPLAGVISVFAARNQLGRLLDDVAERRRSFVIEKRGTPKAVLLGIQEYVRLAAPEPSVLKTIGEQSIRRGTNRLTMRQVDRVVKEARISRRKHAASQAGH